MSLARRYWLVASLFVVTLAGGLSGPARACSRDDAAAPAEAIDPNWQDDGFGTPPEDPWYEPPQAQPGSRSRPGDGLVFKMRDHAALVRPRLALLVSQ